MATCDYCSPTILFGGVGDGDFRFCNEKCHTQEYTLMLSHEIPQDVVEQKVVEVHQDLCPKCQGNGPIGVA